MMKTNYLLLLACMLPLVCQSFPAAEDKSAPLDDTDVDNEHGESVKDSQISKRSGSFDYVTHLKSGILSSIGHASASIASGSSGSSSGGSSGGGDSYKPHDVVVHGNSVDYDPWSFKKSVLNTIFQAVKAITGGVTALKGQLIKGSGYALSAGGNLVSASGDKVTDVGKSIINSAHINSPTYPTSGHSSGGFVHPFAKFSSLSGALSSGSSGTSSGGHKHTSSPIVHTETITTYEIPTGHSNFGSPPTKSSTYSSVTHQYLPPPNGNYGQYSGGAPFSVGHAALEAAYNYLPTAYGQDGSAVQDVFNIYGRHKKLTEEEARKAAVQLQEILNMLPNGKTEYTASKTVTLDKNPSATGLTVRQNDPPHYNLLNNFGHLESLSHTESITAEYTPKPLDNNIGDIYQKMAKQKQKTAEEIYIQKHPNEGYDYAPQNGAHPNLDVLQSPHNEYKYENYHTNRQNNALKDLTPIIAALQVAKHQGQNGGSHVNYAIEKNVHKMTPFNYLPAAVEKTRHTFHTPATGQYDSNYWQNFKSRRHVGTLSKQMLQTQDYELQDPMLFNSMLEV